MRKIILGSVITASLFVLATSYFWAENNYLFVGIFMIFLTMLPLFIGFEVKRIRAEELVVLAVMIAIASVSRVPFAAWPSVQPTSFVIIVAGIAFGAEAGFFIGSMSAFVSNLFLGQGPWTPWQMFAWGMMGFTAGLLRNTFIMKYRWSKMIFGFVWGFLFGWIMNLWFIFSLGEAISIRALVAGALSSLTMDFAHAVCNALFLCVFGELWLKTLCRTREKFGIFQVLRLRKSKLRDRLSDRKGHETNGMDSSCHYNNS